MLSKTDLRNAIASKNRGISATAADKQVIASLVARMEDRNPTPDPLAAPELLAGDWRLLYTTSQGLLGIDRVPLAQLGEIYQCVRPDKSRIYNLAEIKTLPYCEALVSVVASFAPAPLENFAQTSAAQASTNTATATRSQRRVNVKFNRTVVGLRRFLGYQSPAQYVDLIESKEKFGKKFGLLQGLDFAIDADRQQGWLEITYLDKDLRIGRGNQGSLFVLTK